jgi:hypothetical protein
MGWVSIRVNNEKRRLQLSRSSLFGRHQICHGHLSHRDVPLHWLEIRWLGDGWGWRLLQGGSSRTKGTGKALSGGWRVLALGGDVRCGSDVIVELEDAGAPALFAQDLESGECLQGEALEEWVEIWKGCVYPLGSDHELERAIGDCEVRVILGRAFRFYVPGMLVNTDRQRLSIAHPECALDLMPKLMQAVFTVGEAEVLIKGECVRVLLAYARARVEDTIDEGGWLSRRELFQLWQQLGGHEHSSEERVGWEKGKLRTRLTRAGAVGAETLFENRYFEGSALSRLVLPAERVFISDD